MSCFLLQNLAMMESKKVTYLTCWLILWDGSMRIFGKRRPQMIPWISFWILGKSINLITLGLLIVKLANLQYLYVVAWRIADNGIYSYSIYGELDVSVKKFSKKLSFLSCLKWKGLFNRTPILSKKNNQTFVNSSKYLVQMVKVENSDKQYTTNRG